jgi:GNAT superfamily N-acetyltransferase
MEMSSDSVTTYYLEMHAADALISSPVPDDLVLRQVEKPQFQLNRFLYQLVGGQWQWHDKLSWTDQQWKALVSSVDHQTWVAYQQGAIAGYFELQRAVDAITGNTDIEILYFGLAPGFIGQGLGGALLTLAIEHAWCWADTEHGLPNRVWVHTCSLDHPAALKNYQQRGFQVYKTEVV